MAAPVPTTGAATGLSGSVSHAMHTIAEAGHAEITVNRSRFIGAVARAATPQAARAFIAERRRLHHPARHHATAWILGDDAARRHSSDDGEPAGTAGASILSVLAGRDLTDTVAVVTRYFGGVKLGTGGLARAYGQAAAAALDTAGAVARRHVHTVTLTCGHAVAGRLNADLRSNGHTVTATHYNDNVTFDLFVDDVEAFTAWLAGRDTTAHLTVTGTTTIDA